MGTVQQDQTLLNQPKPRTFISNEYGLDVPDMDQPSSPKKPKADSMCSFESSTSSRSGPTPKRNRTRRSLKSPVTRPGKPVEGGPRRKSLSNTITKPRKHALQDLGLNAQNAGFWSSTRSQDQYPSIRTAASKENDTDDPERDRGDTSFGSDVFTSTSPEQVNGLGGRTSTDNYDETTVDF